MSYFCRSSRGRVRIVLGSTADWWDVLAYVMGFAAVLAVEAAFRGRRRPAFTA